MFETARQTTTITTVVATFYRHKELVNHEREFFVHDDEFVLFGERANHVWFLQ